jgi:hypothetical protein
MKKATTLLFAVALCAGFAASGSATVLISDGFNYPAGNLVPNGGWANFSGAVTDLQVTALGRVTGSGPNANDDHKLFTAQATTVKTYACFEVVIPAPAVVGPLKPIYFAMLKDAGTSIFVSRVYVLPLAGGGWTFGISHSSTSTTVGVTPWTSALSFDTNYRVVINYDPTTNTSKLWVNPANELSPSVTDTNALTTDVAVAGFGWRQSASSSTFPPSPGYTGTVDWGFSVDNLGVGNTFDEACGQITPTKSSTWGQVKSIYR